MVGLSTFVAGVKHLHHTSGATTHEETAEPP